MIVRRRPEPGMVGAVCTVSWAVASVGESFHNSRWECGDIGVLQIVWCGYLPPVIEILKFTLVQRGTF